MVAMWTSVFETEKFICAHVWRGQLWNALTCWRKREMRVNKTQRQLRQGQRKQDDKNRNFMDWSVDNKTSTPAWLLLPLEYLSNRSFICAQRVCVFRSALSAVATTYKHAYMVFCLNSKIKNIFCHSGAHFVAAKVFFFLSSCALWKCYLFLLWRRRNRLDACNVYGWCFGKRTNTT